MSGFKRLVRMICCVVSVCVLYVVYDIKSLSTKPENNLYINKKQKIFVWQQYKTQTNKRKYRKHRVTNSNPHTQERNTTVITTTFKTNETNKSIDKINHTTPPKQQQPPSQQQQQQYNNKNSKQKINQIKKSINNTKTWKLNICALSDSEDRLKNNSILSS